MMTTVMIEGQIAQIRAELLKIPVFLKGVGQSVTSESGPRNTTKLANSIVWLKLLLRESVSREEFAKMQKYKYPPHSSQRWMQQSKEREAREQIEELLSLKELAEELLMKNGLLGGMDTAKGLISFAKEIDTEVAQLLQTHIHVPNGSAMLPPKTVHPIGADSMVAVVAWIILAMHKLKKKVEDS